MIQIFCGLSVINLFPTIGVPPDKVTGHWVRGSGWNDETMEWWFQRFKATQESPTKETVWENK